MPVQQVSSDVTELVVEIHVGDFAVVYGNLNKACQIYIMWSV